MRPITFKPVRTSYFATAVALSVAATCIIQSPGFMQALALVGTDAQLPLERIASNGELARDIVPLSDSPREHISADRLVAAHAEASKDNLHSLNAKAQLLRRAPGYRQTITDFKYWT